MAIGSVKGRFYIYIYKDGIYIDFDEYNSLKGIGSYTIAIKYPTDMLDKVINLITDLETKLGDTVVIVHVYRNLSIKKLPHSAAFKTSTSQNKK